MRLKLFIISVLLCFSFTACGSSGSSSDNVVSSSSSSSGFGMDSINSMAVAEDSYTDGSGTDEDILESKGDVDVNKDMLVYRGSISITSKDYAKSIQDLNLLFSNYDCFIENSREYNYSSDGLYEYSATVRVSSSQYNDFMNGVSNLGVVSDKQSSVENMNLEYSDITTALRIYRAREARYLDMLENCYDEVTALEIEDKLTELTIDIAQYESRKALIETDVAYSYVDIEITEVQEYESQIKHTDGFFKRLVKEIGNTFYGFISFLEGLLFLIIRISPYALFIFIIVFILIKCKVIKIKRKDVNKDVSSEKS